MIYFASEFWYRFYASVNFILSQAWLWPLSLSWLSLPSLLLAFTCTERECCSCIQILKTKLSQRVHQKFLCMVFRTIPSKFSCATFKPSKYFLFCDTVFSSWGISVVILYSICQMDFYTWTSGIYIRLSNNLQKELATGCPAPINYNFNH